MLSAPTLKRFVRSAAGFSLIEILVGMVIAMIGILVMTQVFSNSEGQKRTTTGSNDAQNSGAIALFGLQREMREAGWGTSDPKILGCDVLLRTGLTLAAMAPVTINHPLIPAAIADANTDTLLVVYGTTLQSPEGDGITAQPSANAYAVQTPTSFQVNDRVIAMPQARPNPCSGTGALALDKVTAVANPNVTVTTGVAGMANGTLFNFGTSLIVSAYAVRSGKLTRCDLMDATVDCTSTSASAIATSWLPIADNIVALKAQYGRDTRTSISSPSFSVVSSYDNLTPGSAADLAAVALAARPLVCRWARMPAVRFALVARSAQYEKDPVTDGVVAPLPTWEGQTANSPTGSAANPIDVSATATNWANYRYKVFQTTVPLRNITWMGAPTGC